MKKRVQAILLLLALTVSVLSGCSAPDSGGAAGASEGTGTEDTAAAESGTESGGELDTLDIFINMSWYTVDSFTGIIPDYIKEATGVDLNVTIATDANQLGVMIGSGEIPDLVFTDVELDRLSNANLCYSYTELEEQFGASFAEVDEERKAIGRYLSKDGEYYTLLNAYATQAEWDEMQTGAPGQPCIYYRKDLLDQMDVTEINSVDQFMEVLDRCKETYPDKVPFALGGYWKFQILQNALGATANTYNTETGDYYYPATVPAYYEEFLKTANLMARNGYVTPEAYANENEGDGEQVAVNDGCIFYSWYTGTANIGKLQSGTANVNPEAEWAVLPKLGESAIGTSRGWAGTFVSKECSNPEAAARFLSYMNSDEGTKISLWGKEGVDYTLDQDGIPQFSPEYAEARDNGTLNDIYNAAFYLGSFNAVLEVYQQYSGFDETLLADFTTYGDGYVNYPAIGIAHPGSAIDEGIIYNKLEEARKNYEAKVIFAATDEEFAASYQEFMAALEQIGVNDYNSYMKTHIEEVNEALGFAN